ncbi:MAG TPA: YeeE/YedE thiosulfate transporter family protein [Prolixibacteraceae bacterium]|nr:YeeE/YedE thiosulfate transporter family protein [Prolixibacteraceae bacterium]
MGPLVPFIISNEFNLIIALIAGIGFGFVLEQAGFSSTKKLVGLFYGYDFTVLKVFFTAGVTAMIGVLLLGHWGLLDLSLIYINPTFLWSALLGGAIMGVGFIIGGFCPGTAVCAASIGKLDGVAFVFGSGLGVLAFAEGYPMLKNIYLSEAWGGVLMNDILGMSKIAFAFLLTAIAAIAFYLTGLIENRVNGVQSAVNKNKRIIYISSVGFAFVVLAVIAFFPDRNSRIEAQIHKTSDQKDFSSVSVPSDKLASEIVNNYYQINIIDVRDTAAFRIYHLPFAINIPIEKMNNRQWGKILDQKHKANYFYADDKKVAEKAYLLAGYMGKAENYILAESSVNFRKLFSDLTPPGDNANKNEIDTYNFRQKAATDMKMLVDALKNSSEPVVVKISKIKGGC